MSTTGVDAAALRDLSDRDFAARYGVDRFTATVLANRLRYVTQHMATGLLQRAFSPIISTGYDFATAIFGPPSSQYAMPAVNNGLLAFLGTLPDAVRNAVEEFGPDRLGQGDLLICNDPSRVGNHVNDLLLVRPTFFSEELAGFVAMRAHQLDMGGVVPAGFGASKRNVYENGIVLAPQLLFQADAPVPSTFSLIFDNARFAAMLMPDLHTMNQCCALGERLLVESLERYGREAWDGTIAYCIDSGAETMAEAIRSLPDGDYDGESSIDCDGIDADEEYQLRIRIIKRGDRIEGDLSGSSRQARTCINGSSMDAKTAVSVGLKMLVDPQTPFTSGSFRHIDVVVPPGTIMSALPPDGAIFFYWEVESAVIAAMLSALANALDREAIAGDHGSLLLHNANGVRADGTPWASVAECGGEHGARGATRSGDGDGYRPQYLLNHMSPPIEAVEVTAPAMILRREYLPDTGGAGAHRGGPGYLKDVLWRTPGDHFVMPLRFRRPPGVGVRGGGDGVVGGIWQLDNDAVDGSEGALAPSTREAFTAAFPVAGVLDPESHLPDQSGEFVYHGRIPQWTTDAGQMFRYWTSAGGGWGNPLERDPERVKRDVRDGYVSIDGALRDYGVVVRGDPDLHPERLELDLEQTRTERESRRPTHGSDPGP